jgi:hypothetical protein
MKYNDYFSGRIEKIIISSLVLFPVLFFGIFPVFANEVLLPSSVERIESGKQEYFYENYFELDGVKYRVQSNPMAYVNSKFRNTSGWIGGDAVYSVKLTDNKVLWLFGDTLIGEILEGGRVNTIMINNSIGIQDNLNINKGNVEFYSLRDKQGEFKSIFIPPGKNEGFFWIYDGVLIDNTLYLALVQVKLTGEDSAFGFEVVATWIASISNPLDHPGKWRINYNKIPFGNFSSKETMFFGSAFLLLENYLYVYGTMDKMVAGIPDKNMIIARVPRKQVLNFKKWEFFDGKGWTKNASSSFGLAREMANEYTVFYHDYLRKYITVFTYLGNSNRLALRFSDAPQGPWSEPVVVYESHEGLWEKDVLIYAGKGHKWASSKGNELIISYATNLLDPERLIKNANFYWPNFVKVEFEKMDN